jgi:2'-5' RNA ligase
VLRLFASIEPPEDAAREMLRALRKLDLPPAARARETPLAQLHMTVQFIGDTDERELPGVMESVERSVSGLPAFDLRVTRLATLPERGPVRLVAAFTDAPPQLLELHRRLVARLARAPRSKKGDRFNPHLTLARFGGSGTPPRLDLPHAATPFRVGHILLMRSTLRPAGAEHAEIARFELSENRG